MGGHRVDQLEARLGNEIALEQERLVRLRDVGPAPLADLKADRGVADRAGDIEAVAGPDAGAPGHASLRDRTDRGHAQGQGPGRLDRVAAKERAFEGADVGAETLGEGREPFVAPVGGQREREQKSKRPRRLRRKIGEIDPERLAGDRARRIVGEEMDARHQRVGRQHKVFAGRRAHQRRVVTQLKPCRSRQRGEIAGDEVEFAKAGHAGQGRNTSPWPPRTAITVAGIGATSFHCGTPFPGGY